MRSALLMILAALVLQGSTGCSNVSSGGGASAFDDCFNRPPLYRTEHGCDDGN